MELKQLEYFMVTCEKGSFNKAAECLYTTQPNVSKVISSLEKELGRELFERTGKGIRITPYGETVQEYAQNILHNAGGNQHHGFSGNCGAGNCVCGPEAAAVLSTHPFS